MVEQSAVNRWVGGSSPSRGAILQLNLPPGPRGVVIWSESVQMGRMRGSKFFRLCLLLCFGGALFGWNPVDAQSRASSPRFPDILLVTVDTLRADHLTSYGYHRQTTPRLDALIRDGVQFTQARVPEPLTAPSMCSMITSLYPHEHGTSRNGLRMRPDLMSLPKILQRRRYTTAAFVANWTLRDQISGLAEHFDDYNEVFTRKRWYFFASEATAEDVSGEALEWIEDHLDQDKRTPFFVWVHYVEPHAPYRFHKDYGRRLGIPVGGDPSAIDRYDTEIAFVDDAIGEFLDGVNELTEGREALTLFASDHGESLGEHNYWGHGRHLYEPTLHVPMSITWRDRLKPTVIDAPASLLDFAPTIFGLLDLPIFPSFQGVDWTPVLLGQGVADAQRVTFHQAHKGAVQRAGNSSARRQGLLEVARIEDGKKETFRVKNDNHWLFDLKKDRKELASQVPLKSTASDELALWLAEVRAGLEASDELPPPSLDAENMEKLKALGYID